MFIRAAGKLPASGVLFLFFFSIYTFSMSGRILYGDEIEKYRVAQSLVDEHSFSFRPTAMRSAIGADGRNYSAYELGQSILQVPFYAAGRLLQDRFPQPDVNYIAMIIVGLLNPVLTALACVMLFKTSLALGLRVRTGLLLTLVFGLGTVAWPYSRGFTREPLLTLLILSILYSVVSYANTKRDLWLIAAGAGAGYLVFTKFIQGALVPFFVLYIVIVIWQGQRRQGAGWKRTLGAEFRGLAFFCLAAIPFMLLQSAYAWSRFGTLYGGIAGTRGDPLTAIAGVAAATHPDLVAMRIFLTPEKSIFLYSPPILLFLVSWFVWFRVKPKEACLCGALVVVSVASALSRFDGDGGSWWGTRYLVQVTPLMIIPIGALLEWHAQRGRRFWTVGLAFLAVLGVFVSAVGALTNDREYMDLAGTGADLFGQLDSLRHGAFDSLVVYLTPQGFGLQMNPFGILLVLTAVACAVAILARWRDEFPDRVPWTGGWLAVIPAVFIVELAALVIWVVAPYSQVRTWQGNSAYASATRFLADGRTKEASVLFAKAISLDTDYHRQAVAGFEELLPHTPSEPITAADLLFQRVANEGTRIDQDDRITLSGHGSVRVSIPPGKDNSASVMTNWIDVDPDTKIVLSGWIKTVGVYGTSYANVSLYEDDGNWKSPRKVDLVNMDESGGWSFFRQSVTTLPTTRRIMVSAGLWDTFGTLWLDGLELATIAK